MSSWGSSNLQIVVGSIRIGSAGSPLSIADLIPDPAALSDISSITQQKGRPRRKVTARLYTDSISVYNDFISAREACMTAALSISITGTSGPYMVEEVGEPEFKDHETQIFFDVTWIEDVPIVVTPP